MQKVCRETIKIIQDLGKNIEVVPLKGRMSFKYKGKNFATLHPRRDAFVLKWKEHDSWNRETSIKRIERVLEIVDKKIKESYKLVGGTLVSSSKKNTQT